jgi:hypothetical protein
MFWKPLLEHNPTKLVSTQNSIPTANDKSSRVNYSQFHINYYCKNKSPKIAKPVSQATYQYKITLEIGFTHKFLSYCM